MPDRLFFDAIDSTQALAVELARSGAERGTRVVARAQLAGRGRGEHRWSSPPGGLYLSLVGPELAEAGTLLPLALGASLVRLTRERWSVPASLKWPNDVVCPGPKGVRKLAGVLPERVAGKTGGRTVVGVGVNVVGPVESFEPELRSRVALLGEFADPAPGLDELEELVVQRFDRVFRDLGSPTGASQWLSSAREVLYGRGRSALVDGVPAGRIRGLAEDGALQIEGSGGVRSVLSGELVVEEAA